MRETARAVGACVEVAESYGVNGSQARVLRDATNVVVHLAPAPLIARVSMTLGPVRGVQSRDDELGFAAHAKSRGAPVAPPTRMLPPGPHSSEGFLISQLWRSDFAQELLADGIVDVHLGLRPRGRRALATQNASY